VGFSLQLSVRPGTLALAFAAGALITLGTVAGAAFRTSRMAIAAAVRDLPDPASPPRRRWPRITLLVAVAVIGTALLVPSDLRTRLLGGAALIATAAALVRGRLPDRARFTLIGLLLTAWAGIMVAGIHGTSDLYEIVPVILFGVAIAAVGLSVAAAANLRLVEGAIGLAGNRVGLLQATMRPHLSYLSRRPVRTGLATSGFAVVLVLVTVVAVVAAAPKPDYARDSAGYDVEVVTSGPNPIQLPPEVRQQVAGELALPMRVYQGPFSAPGNLAAHGSSVTVTFYTLPEQPLNAAPVYLSSMDKRFGSAAEVWQALRSDPHLAVDAAQYLGDSVTVQGVSGPLQLHVAGSAGSSVLQGIVVSSSTLAEIETRPAGSTLLVKARPGSDPRALARQIERALFDQGVQATSIRDILDQDYASGIDYTTEYDVLLHMGLLVGVLALAMISIRATIERRRPIGILRALGYQPPRVLVGLLGEATMSATIGVVTGIAAGLLMSYFLLAGTTSQGLPVFGVAFGRLGIALAIVYGTVLIVTLPLVARASRMAPAEAIRLTG
jgi:putative ABC transport system permease protein